MRGLRQSLLRQPLVLLAAAAIVGGCSDSSSPGEQVETGRVIVTIKDDQNAPVSGILVYLFATSNKNTPWAATTTTSSGSGEFSASLGGVKVQSYVVRVISLTNYSLATGEVNDKPITVVANQTQTVSFTLVRKQSGQT
jgi:hypothetical protein